MKNKLVKKTFGSMEYEVELRIRVKGDIEINHKAPFEEECMHPSGIAQWVLEDIEDDFESKHYEVIGFDKFILSKGKDHTRKMHE